MNKIYRIYLGARNTPRHAITSGDDAIITNVLRRYFKGWTLTSTQGIWDGTEEESKVITVVVGNDSLTATAGSTPVESCAKQLKQHFSQYAVMVEAGGNASFF